MNFYKSKILKLNIVIYNILLIFIKIINKKIIEDIGGDGNGDGIIMDHGVEIYETILSLNEAIGKL